MEQDRQLEDYFNSEKPNEYNTRRDACFTSHRRELTSAQFHLKDSGYETKIWQLKEGKCGTKGHVGKSILCNSKIVQLVGSQQWQIWQQKHKVSNPSLSLADPVIFNAIVTAVGEVGEGTPGRLDGEGAS